MEDKLKLLQKHFKNDSNLKIFMTNGYLYTTDLYNLGIYKIENKETKLFDGNTLEEINLYNLNNFPNLLMVKNNFLVNLDCEIEINKKVLLKFLEDIILNDKLNNEKISFVFSIENNNLFLKKDEVKNKIIILNGNFKNFKCLYEVKILHKYLTECKNDIIKVKYSSTFKDMPLLIKSDIYTLVTMPCRK